MDTKTIKTSLKRDFDKDSFLKKFNSEGSVVIPGVLTPNFVEQAKKELLEALDKEVEYQGTTDYDFYGYVLCNAVYGGSFLKLFDNKMVVEPINAVMGEGSIAYSYTSSSMPPGKGNDSSQIHVDCPIYLDNYILRMGVLIALDDFTENNGATFYLPGSQNQETAPDEAHFFKNAKRLLLKAGDAWYFNTRLWHSGGQNSTQEWRHALTLNMCRPWMKQRIDIPALMKQTDLRGASDTALQKLGFFSQIPTSFEEYFAPPEKRPFRQTNI